MSLSHVAEGQPHVQAHNDERDALNALQGESSSAIAMTWVYDPDTGWPTRPPSPGGLIANSVRWVDAPPPIEHVADDLWFRHPNSTYVPSG